MGLPLGDRPATHAVSGRPARQHRRLRPGYLGLHQVRVRLSAPHGPEGPQADRRTRQPRPGPHREVPPRREPTRHQHARSTVDLTRIAATSSRNATMTPTFVKTYATADAARTAAANHRWLNANAAPMRLPALVHQEARHLEFERIHGRHAQPGDLKWLASHLGAAHA